MIGVGVTLDDNANIVGHTTSRSNGHATRRCGGHTTGQKSATGQGVSWLKYFKRYDLHQFIGSKEDPTAAQIWITTMQTTFESMKCPDNHKVACTTYVLQKDAEVWWVDNKQNINPGEGITTWETFKETFLKYYYPRNTRIKNSKNITT